MLFVVFQDETQHLAHLDHVFQRIADGEFVIAPPKCYFFAEDVEVLGYLMTCEYLRPTHNNILKLMSRSTPHDTTELRSFLGLTGYYHRLVPDYMEVARPLYRLLKLTDKEKEAKETILPQESLPATKRNRRFDPDEWTEDHQHAFEQLRRLVIEDATDRKSVV